MLCAASFSEHQRSYFVNDEDIYFSISPLPLHRASFRHPPATELRLARRIGLSFDDNATRRSLSLLPPPTHA